MTEWRERLLVLLFPHKCFLCGAVLEGTGWLCKGCELPTTGEALCTCGKRREECACKQLEGGYEAATAPFYYTDGVEHGIHRFKYSGRSYYAPFLGAAMAQKVQEQFGGVRFDWITYVPLSRRGARKRGYCQTLLLARALSARLGIPVRGGLLAHTGEGSAQAQQKGFAARRKNVERKFVCCTEAELTGRNLLLVDDVLTTGSTARKCAALLRERGAAVWVVTAATTRRKKEFPCKNSGIDV